MAIELKAQLREQTGTAYANYLRRKELLPAILYGRGLENKNLQVDLRDIERILRTKLGINTLIQLKIEGDQEYMVLIKTHQGHPVSRELSHVDFWNVKEDQEVEVMVDIRLDGKAPGLLQGGIMERPTHSVKLQCHANAIPDELVVDVSQLELGQSIHLADVSMPEGAKRRDDYNPTIASMVEEKQVEEVVEAAPIEEGAEPAEEGKEGEKPEEGKAEDKGGEKAAEKPEDKGGEKK